MPGFSPLGSQPLGFDGDDAPPPAPGDDLASSALLHDDGQPIFLNVLEDGGTSGLTEAEALIINALWGDLFATTAAIGGIRVSMLATTAGTVVDLADSTVMDNIRDAVLAYAGADSQARFKSALSGSGQFADAVAVAWNMLVSDAGSMADDAAATVAKLAVIAEALLAVGTVDSRLSARIAVAVAAILEGKAATGWSADALDQAALTDDVRGMLAAIQSVTDAAQAADAATGNLSLLALASDASTVGDTPDALLRAVTDLDDGAVLFCTVRLGGIDYQGWVLNTQLRAVTEYRNVPFDSFAILNGRTYAAGDGGIFELAGETDDGQPIEAWFRPFLTDMGSSKLKRVTDIWIGTNAVGLFVKVHTKDPVTGLMVEDIYPVDAFHGPGSDGVRAQLGRGLRSHWWSCTIQNIDGADFAVDSIAWRPLILDRRQ